MPDFDGEQVAKQLSTLLSSVDDENDLQQKFIQFNDDERNYRNSSMSRDTGKEIYDRMNQYHTMTDIIGQMNEAQNANEYMMRILGKESSRVAKLNMEARKEIYKIQQKFLTIAYRRQYYRFITNVMLFTWGATAVLAAVTGLFLQELMEPVLYYIALGVLLALYAIALVSAFSYEGKRRRYHWKQFYWSVGDNIKKSMEDSKESSNVGECK